ncbi:hypothetical protein EYF80_039309 [Liparis tanakae]|uniref:Uncharacterized protein n=1 Tax=Liparis tanakae TaxID=230148 RepID=A0A4Z2GAT5_9TELE|nr:hypothetical protein EYF80_039309 [Liparis tanakae]
MTKDVPFAVESFDISDFSQVRLDSAHGRRTGTKQCSNVGQTVVYSEKSCPLAPPNTESSRSSGHDETSIPLQGKQVNTSIIFTLQFTGTEETITAPDGDGPVTHSLISPCWN